MRFSVAVAVATLASSVSASLVARQLPQCANSCIMSADLGGCQPTDNACLCKSQKFVNSTTTCIGTQCTGSDLQAALTAAQQLCAVVGVTLTSIPSNFPTGGVASSTGASPTTSGSAAGTTPGSAAPASQTGNSASFNGISFMAGAAALGLAALAL
ncbi:hypothetical protein P691DRAFT_772556 [Macrolepiota fuliginosa MF-IS2]|uniref:CFEM domain-containing protein n=1 Tax=Macrolepiota fuliginosa MF-IS2 TaxID=1400762 RepID=A0A9P6C7N4_9AGAR|nr:hypothetical protein P691DRAFT_772556 [Macrolepiota fuliginosa MF-IS2]